MSNQSRADRFDRGDFRARDAARRNQSDLIWPIDGLQLLRLGQSVMTNRDGTGRPHMGIDIFAETGALVLAARDGEVLRVIDGRSAPKEALRRAGLFIDVQGPDGRVYRYLHLGTAAARAGDALTQGAVIGTVARAFTSGLRESPHLHFEIRASDRDGRHGYGAAVNPLSLLPKRSV